MVLLAIVVEAASPLTYHDCGDCWGVQIISIKECMIISMWEFTMSHTSSSWFELSLQTQILA